MGERSIQGTVLITGASGFIGGRLARRVLDAGADVVSLRRAGSPEARRGAGLRRRRLRRLADGLRRLVEKEHPPQPSTTSPAPPRASPTPTSQRANVTPSRTSSTLLRDAASPDLRRFVLFSSLGAYGPSRAGAPHRESAPRRPVELYGQSKLEAEQVVEAAGDALPGPWFSSLYVDDLVRAALDAAEHDATRGGPRSATASPPPGAPSRKRSSAPAATASSPRPARRNRRHRRRRRRAPHPPRPAAAPLQPPEGPDGAQEAWTRQHDALRADTGYAPRRRPRRRRAHARVYRAERWL